MAATASKVKLPPSKETGRKAEGSTRMATLGAKRTTVLAKGTKTAPTQPYNKGTAGLSGGRYAKYIPKGNPAPGTKPTTPTTPAKPPTPTTPFLTPAQQAAWSAYQTKYGYNVTALNQALSTGQANEVLAVGNAKLGAAQNSSNADQSAAARGIFASSINKSDLTDINTALTMRENLLDTGLKTLQMNTATRLGTLSDDYNTTDNYYNQIAVQNAQGEPVAPDPTTPPTPAPPAPKPPAPKTQKPPQPTKVTNQPRSTNPPPETGVPKVQKPPTQKSPGTPSGGVGLPSAATASPGILGSPWWARGAAA